MFSSIQDRMDPEKVTVTVTCINSSNQENYTTRSTETAESQLVKTLAQRALHGSSRHHRTGRRRIRNNDVGPLPSRLSKVCLADKTEN